MIAQKLAVALLLAPLALHSAAAFSEDRAAANTKVSGIRISTGVVAPRLLQTSPVFQGGNTARVNTDAKVVVSLTVDAKGHPADLKVIESAGAIMDKSVLDAVSHYRYQAGTVSGQAIDFPIRLEVTLQHTGL